MVSPTGLLSPRWRSVFTAEIKRFPEKNLSRDGHRQNTVGVLCFGATNELENECKLEIKLEKYVILRYRTVVLWIGVREIGCLGVVLKPFYVAVFISSKYDLLRRKCQLKNAFG